MAEKDLYNTPITPADAAGMFKTTVSPNERPFTAKVMHANNHMVEDWQEKVLRRMCDSTGCVPSGIVLGSWQLYAEGLSVHEFMKLKEKGMITKTDPKLVEVWKRFILDSSIEELHKVGSACISRGFTVLENYWRTWYAEKKWDKLYSKSEDPYYWQSNYKPHKALITGKILPDGWTKNEMQDVSEKVATVLRTQVKVAGGADFSRV